MGYSLHIPDEKAETQNCQISCQGQMPRKGRTKFQDMLMSENMSGALGNSSLTTQCLFPYL